MTTAPSVGQEAHQLDVDDLLAHAAIQQVLMRYCRGVDRGDLALLQSVYHDGAIDRHGQFDGLGVDFAAGLVKSMDAAGTVGQHHITNVLIELDGREANVESYFLALHPAPSEGDAARLAFVGGRYLDRFSCRDGRWAIADRTVILDWSRRTSSARRAGGGTLSGRRPPRP